MTGSGQAKDLLPFRRKEGAGFYPSVLNAVPPGCKTIP